jgi:hypothetical protein
MWNSLRFSYRKIKSEPTDAVGEFPAAVRGRLGVQESFTRAQNALPQDDKR